MRETEAERQFWEMLYEDVEGHTPGPWDGVVSTWSVRTFASPPRFGNYICNILGQTDDHRADPDPEARANKALIAAAPTLLDEVKRCHALLAELATSDVATLLGIAGHGCEDGCRAPQRFQDESAEHRPECLCARMKKAIADRGQVPGER